ncbi:hypothetical protein NI17_020750 [Thermobifida halotolerans]|uniref:Uncharacterized protein n=1 Tax=Thermobifida halotolerans TaxID=483545 RepID=A0A399FUU6_9ACTN|nr:hypothetical protein [Thermobifida halotolerans]UOE19156.1 hypothetical protein NI17_020750 [Thermobifida halotolerans]
MDGLLNDLPARTEGADSAPVPPLPAQGSGEHFRYRSLTDAAVRYLPVFREGVLLGCLWAAETDDAAGFVAVGADAVQVERFWTERLVRCGREGMRPLQALHRWVGAAEDPVGGAVPAEARERIAVTLDALRGLPWLR